MRVKPERIENKDREYACCAAILELLEETGLALDKIAAIGKLVDDFYLARNLDNFYVDQIRRNPWLWPDE